MRTRTFITLPEEDASSVSIYPSMSLSIDLSKSYLPCSFPSIYTIFLIIGIMFSRRELVPALNVPTHPLRPYSSGNRQVSWLVEQPHQVALKPCHCLPRSHRWRKECQHLCRSRLRASGTPLNYASEFSGTNDAPPEIAIHHAQNPNRQDTRRPSSCVTFFEERTLLRPSLLSTLRNEIMLFAGARALSLRG